MYGITRCTLRQHIRTGAVPVVRKNSATGAQTGTHWRSYNRLNIVLLSAFVKALSRRRTIQ